MRWPIAWLKSPGTSPPLHKMRARKSQLEGIPVLLERPKLLPAHTSWPVDGRKKMMR